MSESLRALLYAAALQLGKHSPSAEDLPSRVFSPASAVASHLKITWVFTYFHLFHLCMFAHRYIFSFVFLPGMRLLLHHDIALT